MLKEMNKENGPPFIPQSNAGGNENALEARVRVGAVPVNQRHHPLIHNQVDLNRQINNLNRVNRANNINHEINNRQPANVPENGGGGGGDEENRFVPKMCDSIPITPEHFLKFFSL